MVPSPTSDWEAFELRGTGRHGKETYLVCNVLRLTPCPRFLEREICNNFLVDLNTFELVHNGIKVKHSVLFLLA
jgi:hypothetical protein